MVHKPIAALQRLELPVCLAAAISLTCPAFGASPGAMPERTMVAPISAFLALKDSHSTPHSRIAHVPLSSAAGIVVNSCGDDGGFDQLRHALITVDSGGTIDLSGVSCTISLGAQGALSVPVDNVTIVGPGSGKLTIDAHQASRVLTQVNTYTLTLQGLTIANGKATGTEVKGGCIYSKGNLVLTQTTVTGCTALGQSLAAGGGIYAAGTLKAYYSTLSNNHAESTVGASGMASAAGAGAISLGQMTLTSSMISGNTVKAPIGSAYGGGVISAALTAKYSTFTGNSAVVVASNTTPQNYSVAGGVGTAAGSVIWSCTIDNNTADAGAGVFIGSAGTDSVGIAQTTISSNIANVGAAAILNRGTLNIANSTIAFNSGGDLALPAVALGSGTTNSIDSTIIADNTPLDLDGGGAIGGNHNLIKTSGSNVTLPALTIQLDPQLGPLQYNGGYTRTHALTMGSVAIDQGSLAGTVDFDQRGPAYRRIAGSGVDIGAVEYDPDHIFGNSFSPKPPGL